MLQHPRLRQWCLQLLARDFELSEVNIQDPDVVGSVDMLLFDEASAAEQQHWLDLFRRRLAPDSPPLLLLQQDNREAGQLEPYFDGLLCILSPLNELLARLHEWGALHYSAKVWTMAAMGKIGRPGASGAKVTPPADIPLQLPDDLCSGLFLRLSEIASQGMFICDSNGTLRFVNAALCQLTGYQRHDLLGKSVQMLLPRLTHGDCFGRFRQFVRQWQGWEGELVGFGKDGTHLRVWLQLQPAGNIGRDDEAMTLYAGTLTDLSSSRKLEACILQLAQTDSLSDLNRILFEEKLTLDLAMAQQQGHSVALLHIELPAYRLLAEQVGHSICSRLVSEQLNRMEQVVAQGGFCSRISASHYGVILAQSEPQPAALLVAQRLVTALEQPVLLDDIEICCPAVVGYSCFPQDATEAETLLRNADLAAKWCKENPPEQICRYTPALLSFLEHDSTLLNDLKRGIEENAFFLVYQPQIALRTGETVGLEALVRWQRTPELVVEPKVFIPLAESSGLIISLTHQILKLACAQLQTWLAQGEMLKISVNISAIHFQHANLVDDIRRVLEQYQVPAGYLELELTETCLIKDINSATQTLHELKQLGVSIAIDDFGTGYSSLGYMKQFPIDSLKIDQSFVHDIVRDNADAVIVRSIIALGHAMGYRVIAEGVETQEQLEYLTLMKCDEVQGYLLAHPLPVDEVLARLDHLKNAALPVAKHAEPRYLLLVDDEKPILNALKRTLHGAGYQLLLASDAEQAWHYLAHHAVGVMVCDNRMPGVSGLTLLREVKQRYPQVSRIMLSGYADLVSLSDAINAGEIMRFIAKPWDEQELKLAIHDAFSRYEHEVFKHGNMV